MTPTPRTSLAAHNLVPFSNFVNVDSLTCSFMAKRSTTAEVTIEAESNFGYSRCVETGDTAAAHPFEMFQRQRRSA